MADARKERLPYCYREQALGGSIHHPSHSPSSHLTSWCFTMKTFPVEILSISALELSRRLHSRELTAVELMETTLDRVDEVNSSVNAIIALRGMAILTLKCTLIMRTWTYHRHPIRSREPLKRSIRGWWRARCCRKNIIRYHIYLMSSLSSIVCCSIEPSFVFFAGLS